MHRAVMSKLLGRPVAGGSGGRGPGGRFGDERGFTLIEVAMAIVVAQINPLRNGRSVHRLPASRTPMTSTNRTTRVISLDA